MADPDLTDYDHDPDVAYAQAFGGTVSDGELPEDVAVAEIDRLHGLGIDEVPAEVDAEFGVADLLAADTDPNDGERELPKV
jgi:hypothetical protein